MSLWSKAKKAARKAAKKVAKATSTVVNTVSEVVSDAAETAGNAVESGLNALADAASGIPGVGGAVSTFVRWSARIAGAASDMVAAGIKASAGLLGGTLSGTIQIGYGTLTLDWPMIRDGYIEMSSGITGSVILFGGKTIAFLQAAFPGIEQRRELTDREKDILLRVFRNSLALHNIRLVDSKYGAGVLGMGERPYTLGDTIYLMAHSTLREPELLVHESTHVWQYQNTGSSYASDAIGAQMFVPDTYNWEREIQRGSDEWTAFNREAQATFIEDIYVSGELLAYAKAAAAAGVASGSAVGQSGGVFYDANGYDLLGRFVFNKNDHTIRANNAVEVVRNTTNMRLSEVIG